MFAVVNSFLIFVKGTLTRKLSTLRQFSNDIAFASVNVSCMSNFMYKHTLVQPKNAQTTRIDIYQSNTLNTQFLGHVGTLVTATRNLRFFYSRVLLTIVGSAGLRGAQSLCQLRQRAPKKQGVALSSGP